MKTIITNLLIIVILYFTMFSVIKAQWTYRMYWNSISIINPASTGLNYNYYAAVTGRELWIGYIGAPFEISAILDMKAESLHGGAGVNYNYDDIPFVKTHNINVNYAYHLSLPDEQYLSFGISGGLIRKMYNFPSVMNEEDPLIPANNFSENIFSSKFGVIYKNRRLEAGISSSYALEPQKIKSDIAPNYYFYASYRLNLGKSITVTPGAIFFKPKYSDDELNSYLLVMFKERLWGGLSCSNNKNLGIMAGFDFAGKYRVGYSFDSSSSFPGNFNSQELVLALKL